MMNKICLESKLLLAANLFISYVNVTTSPHPFMAGFLLGILFNKERSRALIEKAKVNLEKKTLKQLNPQPKFHITVGSYTLTYLKIRELALTQLFSFTPAVYLPFSTGLMMGHSLGKVMNWDYLKKWHRANSQKLDTLNAVFI
jgi:hypothetical protein